MRSPDPFAAPIPLPILLLDAFLTMQRLIFCRTPLQAMIAAAIRSVDPAVDTLVYQPTSASPKHRLYFDRLPADQKIFIPYLPDGRSHFVKELRSYFRIPAAVRCRCFDAYLIASFDSLVFSMLVSHSSGIIDMYDDGLMNLLPSEINQRLRGESLLHHWVKALLGAPHVSEIVARTRKHFTIYRPRDLIIGHDRAVPLDLFAPVDAGTSDARPLRVLLGTPIAIHEGETTPEILANYDRYCDIPFDIFIAHPSEALPSRVADTVPDAGVWRTVIDTHIAEDVLRQLREQGFAIEVFGISSSAIVNAASMASVTNVTIPGVNDVDLEVYNRLGIASLPLSSLNGI